jgi:pentatricopeptide repeat protein
VRNMTDGKNVIVGWWDLSTYNFYDCFDCWNEWDGDLYWVHYCGEKSYHAYCCSSLARSTNVYYSYFLEGCSFCLWCVWLKNKSYCILNKQYTKEERYEKVDEIFSQMESEGVLWSFLPPHMNPFYFNDTAAYLMDSSFTKEEVTKLWYMRRDAPIKVDIPDWMEVIKTTDLSQYESYKDWQRNIDPSILKKVIIDEEGNSYRVVKLEYDFLVKHGLPLPRKHWLERMKDNFRL